jgi:hypothetical protein
MFISKCFNLKQAMTNGKTGHNWQNCLLPSTFLLQPVGSLAAKNSASINTTEEKET